MSSCRLRPCTTFMLGKTSRELLSKSLSPKCKTLLCERISSKTFSTRAATGVVRHHGSRRLPHARHATFYFSSSALVGGVGCAWLLSRPTRLMTCCEAPRNAALYSSADRAEESTNEIVVAHPHGDHYLDKLWRALRMVRRFLKLSITLAPIIAFYPVLMLMRKPEGEDAHAVVLRHDEEEDEVTGLLGWYLNLCLTCVEYSGAAVIKLMQWAGSRPDLFGHDFCAVFSKLQDQTTPHRWKYTEKALREAFGEDWRDHLELNGILGSGCIGQVYEGHTIPQHEGETSQKVAVKVLHPQVHEDIDADLDLMRFAVRAVRYLPFDVFANLKWLNMEGVVEEFAGLLKLQLDLRKEAENLEQFNENFRGDDSVEFPKLVKGFRPTENVLVETFCEGTPVIQFCRDNRDNQEMLSKMCRTAIRAVSKMIFLDNFVHGDLHPGNVFVSPDGKRFVLFDVGIVNEYQESDHNAIVDILAAFIRYQGRKAGRLMIDDSNSRLRAMNDGEVAVREKEYIDKIEYLTIKASGKDYLMEHLGTYISYICEAAAEHHIMLNPAFVSAALAVKVQEGIALALDPRCKVQHVAIPIIVESEARRTASHIFDLDRVKRAIFGDDGNDNKQNG